MKNHLWHACQKLPTPGINDRAIEIKVYLCKYIFCCGNKKCNVLLKILVKDVRGYSSQTYNTNFEVGRDLQHRLSFMTQVLSMGSNLYFK